jgi:hypothetical protein
MGKEIGHATVERLIDAMAAGKTMVLRFDFLAERAGQPAAFDGEAVIELQAGRGGAAVVPAGARGSDERAVLTIGAWFGFQAVPLEVSASVGLIVVVYLVCAELVKQMAVGSVARRPGACLPQLASPSRSPR